MRDNEIMINDENYYEFLDIAKGIAILLVVLGHTIIPSIRGMHKTYSVLFEIIYSFHMPLFAAISGYLFEKKISKYKENGFWSFAGKRFTSLMLPYFSFSILSYIFFGIAFFVPVTRTILTEAGYSQPEILKSIIQILFCQGNMDKHLWYVYVYFFILMLSYLFSDFFKSPVGILLSIAMFFFNYFFIFSEAVYHFFAIFVFFNIARQTALIDKLLSKKKLFLFLAVFILTLIIRLERLVVWNRILDAGILMVIGFSGAIVVMQISSLFVNGFPKRLFILLGKESFSIYLIHQPIFVSGMCGLLIALTPLPAYIICLIALVVSIPVSLFIANKIIMKIPIWAKIMLGISYQKSK